MGLLTSQKAYEREALLSAVMEAQAVIEFDMNGVILSVNPVFEKVMGYSLAELVGKNHSLFVTAEDRQGGAYKAFWDRLRSGQREMARYKRLAKGGREVWLDASYNPIRDRAGNLVKVVKFASDVTERQTRNAELNCLMDGLNRSQAMIEFALDGTVLTANQNFLDCLGYRLEEIKGKSHRMFVGADYARSAEYDAFWKTLRSGKFHSGQFKRVRKDGKEVWIEGTYNPILDADGRPYKVVKFARDITEQEQLLSDLKTLIDVNFAEINGSLAETRTRAGNADAAAHDASANVNMLASATEELATSIAEIASSMANSHAAARGAREKTDNAGDAAQRLAEATTAMTGIIGLIQNIAGQINLLALNATIESARAGDAGKGFAVVANEVKTLANQAAKATEQISQEIARVQGVSDEVVATLGEIRASVSDVQEYVSATASAVEEQSAVTRDMSANMQGAAGAVVTISSNVADIGAAVGQVENAVQRTLDAAAILTR